MKIKIEAIILILCFFATLQVQATTGGAPRCVIKTVFTGQQAGQACPFTINDIPYDGQTTGAYEIEVCGGTLPQCGGVPSTIITIGGANEPFYRNVTVTPDYLEEPGTHNVTVTFQAPGCVDVNAGGAANYTTVTATVAVTVPDLIECGPCMPLEAEWVCNDDAYDCSLQPEGRCGLFSSPSRIAYLNMHRFYFERDGISQGRDVVVTEVVEMSVHVVVTTNSEDLLYDSGASPLPEFIDGDGLFCTIDCPGPGSSVLGDRYYCEILLPDFATLATAACQFNPGLGTYRIKVRATHDWDQRLYSQYGHPTAERLFGTYHSSVTLGRTGQVSWTPYNCNGPISGWWEDDASVVSKSGNI